jgi:hypothetical protein
MTYNTFSFTDEDYIIFRTIETFSRTSSGKSWKSKPEEVENDIITPAQYTSYITAIPFFNSWGDGAYCRARFSYNMPGYLPTTVTTVSPHQITKKIARFWFLKKEHLLLNAGWREKDIVEKAERFRVEYINGWELIHFYTNDTGVTAAGIYDVKARKWRG